MTDLRTAALAAYEQLCARSLENQLAHNARVQERAKNFFDETFGMFPDRVSVSNDGEIVLVIVTAGDIRLQFIDSSFYLMGVCPDCGQEVGGYRVFNLESLGAAIDAEFSPNHRHNCRYPVVNTPESTGDRPLWIEDAVGMIDLASGHEGPATPRDAAVLGQLYALIAIATELRRANDRNDRLDNPSSMDGGEMPGEYDICW